MSDMSADVIGLDWSTEMASARRTLGGDVRVQGNVDPLLLFAPEQQIRDTVRQCIADAGKTGHILNVGHGVAQGTPEENVGLFCQLAHESGAHQKELVAA
jgi:uroporphyrinogen decarboxylase